ncbi:MAG: RNA 2',3'-cyclic phosphodiesterase [Bacteroidales bacterium]|nr:RNA 2',3'-cyclic phosphodiesterase [Bacteroidales bacterium]
MKRIFAAIKITPDEGFMNIYYGLKNALKNEKIKWVDPHNIHITLKFFGETIEGLIPDISDSLKHIAANHSSFDIKFSKTGVFGSSYKPRVIWLGIEKNEILESLGQDILSNIGRLGFKHDRQNFVPHLTLGRIKYIENKRSFNEEIKKYSNAEMQKQIITKFHLIESKLKPSGPEYHTLYSYGLK